MGWVQCGEMAEMTSRPPAQMIPLHHAPMCDVHRCPNVASRFVSVCIAYPSDPALTRWSHSFLCGSHHIQIVEIDPKDKAEVEAS